MTEFRGANQNAHEPAAWRRQATARTHPGSRSVLVLHELLLENEASIRVRRQLPPRWPPGLRITSGPWRELSAY